MDVKELYVSAGGDAEFSEVGRALEAARQYDGMKVVIHIASGVYNERIVVNQNNISFVGVDENTTKIT
ncbi:MAG: hypothetical protein K2N90_09200, partial [Lachnospiraceae bacterium]|nr:hypothetical protein [Lachnospiraceae bacterium]